MIFRNTSINIANFVVTFLTRIIITNSVYFIFGDSSLGLVSSIIALNSLAVALASIFELRIAKGRMSLKRSQVLLLAINVLLVAFVANIALEVNLLYSAFLILLFLLMNANLVLSGYLFHAELFFCLSSKKYCFGILRIAELCRCYLFP